MPKLVENALVIYPDGSLKWRGRKGGYGIVFVHINEIGEEQVMKEEAPPGARGVTGNRMELTACIRGLRSAPDIECYAHVSKVVVRSDSTYVVGNSRLALTLWRKQGWRNADGRPVANADLWKEFVRVYDKIHKPKLIEWLKGHGKGRQKNIHNARADALANESALSPLSRKEYRSSVRRKLSAAHTRSGSVRLFGQTMLIHVIEAERMRVQREWKYRYEVVSPESSDRGAIDWIFSSEQMRDGRFYEVRVNDNMRYPRVEEVLRHVDRTELPPECGITGAEK